MDHTDLGLLWLTDLKRQHEPDPMGQEEAEYKKDPTLPVSLLTIPSTRVWALETTMRLQFTNT